MCPYGQAAGFENQNDGTWDAYSIKIEGWTAADQENVAASAESDVGVMLYDACGAPGSPVLSQTGPLKLSITFDIPSSPWGIPLAGGAWYQNIDSFTAQLSTSADPFTAAESATALPRPGWRCFLSSPSACCERAVAISCIAVTTPKYALTMESCRRWCRCSRVPSAQTTQESRSRLKAWCRVPHTTAGSQRLPTLRVRASPASSLRSWNGLRHISYGPLQAPLLKFCCRLHCANNVCALPGEQERSVASHLVSKRLTRPRRQGSLRSWREQSAVRALGSMGNSKRPTLK